MKRIFLSPSMRSIRYCYKPELRSLDDLAAEVRRLVEGAFQRKGAVRPALLALTPSGLFTHFPERLENEEDKDRFALECRLLLSCTGATLSAIVLEAWMADVVNGMLPSVPPSQSPRRREVVTVSLESRQGERFLIWSIERSALGVFTGLEANLAPEGMQARGRFAPLLPRRPVHPEEQRRARGELERLGVRTEGKAGGLSVS